MDGSGNAYIIGTTSGNFPTTSAFDQSYNGGDSDAVVVKLQADGGGLDYSTYLGTSGTDAGIGITVENGIAIVTGETSSADFPRTTNAYQMNFGGGIRDAFVTYINAEGDGLIYSTYLGGSGYEWAPGISSTSNGIIASAGNTGSGDFPATIGAYANSYVTNFNDAKSTIPEMEVITTKECNGGCGQPVGNTQGIKGKPINTRTGGQFYQTEDIRVSTAAEELNFFRTYASLTTDIYSSMLGYGWTHNLDTRLIFPDDPGGQPGFVLFKEHTANQYQFTDHGNGTYSPVLGIVGTLTLNGGQYILTLANQNKYIFDSTGRLLTRMDSQGHSWDYSYTAGGLLEQVSAEGGTRYLTLGYDGQGRIVSVTDHTGRSITYTYDGNGDLISATSLGGGA